jgi:hypothetical protein
MRLVAVILTAAAILPALAQQQSGFSTLGFASLKVSKALAETTVALAAYAAEKNRVASNVATARRDFWQRYPNGPGLEQAAEAYALALRERDLLLFSEMQTAVGARSIAGPSLGPTQYDRILSLVSAMTGGPVDGGIHPYVRPRFSAWFSAANAVSPLGSVAFNDEANQSLPAYERYVTARDLGEYLFNSDVSPLKSNDPREYAIGVLAATRLSYDYLALSSLVDGLIKSVGTARFNEAVSRLRAADAAEGIVDKDLAGQSYGSSWGRFRYLLGLTEPACHDLAGYDSSHRTSLEDVHPDARGFQFTDACGTHGIDYVILGHAALITHGFGRNSMYGYDQRILVFRDSAGRVYVAGRENDRFVVHSVPLAEIEARVAKSDTAWPDANELAKLSDEEFERWLRGHEQNRAALLERITTINEEIVRDYPAARLLANGRAPSTGLGAFRGATNIAAAVWLDGR